MTAHELARKLLEGPDVLVAIQGHAPNEDTFDEVSEIDPVNAWQVDYGHGIGFDAALFDAEPRNTQLKTRQLAPVRLR